MENNNKENIWFCVFNPTAGTREYKNVWEEVEKELVKNELNYEVYFTKFHNDATDITITKIKEGYRKFIAIGGDGTVHEVVNAFMKQEIVSSKELTLAVLPVGTGNDWAKHHCIPSDISGAVSLIKSNNISNQDVGIAYFYKDGKEGKEYFNNVAGMAYDAFVVEQLEKRESKPNKLVYIFSVLSYLFKYKLQKAELIIDNKLYKGKFYTINIGICKYSGGGMSLVPHAIHNDGLFAVTYAKEISKIDIVLNTYRFYNESLIDHPRIDGVQAKEISVKSLNQNPVNLELDGEMVGHTPVRFEIMDRSLKFISSK